jgi:hypothetical protein
MLNTTTQQPNSQTDMSPEDAKASLGIATNLMSQLMPQAPMDETSQEQEGTPVNQPEPEPQPSPEETNQELSPEDRGTQEVTEKVDALSKDLQGFKGEVEGIIKTKMDDLANTIKDALK